MNDFFDSLKEIKKDMVKGQKQAAPTQKKEPKQGVSKEEAIAHKEEILREEFLKYVKDSDIRKI